LVKKDEAHHEGLRSTRRRLDAAVAEMQRERDDVHAPIKRYFSLFHGETQVYSKMGIAKSAIDP